MILLNSTRPEEVLVGLGNLAQNGIGPHVLDVGLDERSPLLDGLDDVLLARDGLIDQRVLRCGRLARSRENILLASSCLQERQLQPVAGRVVATKSASSRPAVDCFRRIMIYGSYGDPRVSLIWT